MAWWYHLYTHIFYWIILGTGSFQICPYGSIIRPSDSKPVPSLQVFYVKDPTFASSFGVVGGLRMRKFLEKPFVSFEPFEKGPLCCLGDLLGGEILWILHLWTASTDSPSTSIDLFCSRYRCFRCSKRKPGPALKRSTTKWCWLAHGPVFYRHSENSTLSLAKVIKRLIPKIFKVSTKYSPINPTHFFPKNQCLESMAHVLPLEINHPPFFLGGKIRPFCRGAGTFATSWGSGLSPSLPAKAQEAKTNKRPCFKGVPVFLLVFRMFFLGFLGGDESRRKSI